MTTELRGVKEFNARFRAWARNKPRERVILAQKGLGLQILRDVIQRSPVDTGRYRGNHRVAIGRELSGELDQNDPGGGATMSRGSAVIERLSADAPLTFIWIGNTARHAAALEAGWSTQAPQGIYALAVQATASTLPGGPER